MTEDTPVEPENKDQSVVPDKQEAPKNKMNWRQVLKTEMRKIYNHEVTVNSLTDEQFLRYRRQVKLAVKAFTSLVGPLTSTFLIVVIIMTNLPFFKSKVAVPSLLIPLEEKATHTGGVKFSRALVNACIMLSFVVLMTVTLFLLYKYKFYWILNGFLYLTTLYTQFALICQLCSYYNIAMDWITGSFLILNAAAVGSSVIFTGLSPRLQRCYHVCISAFIACTFIKVFPEWTGWVVLGFFVIWDLIAVLSPFGPLKLLVETAISRGEQLFPSLVFKTMVEPRNHGSASSHFDPETPTSTTPITPAATEASPVEEDESQPPSSEELTKMEEESDHGSQLGLGDFIFFSILIGKTMVYVNLNVVFIAYLSVIFGFLVTYVILICLGRALPALPVSLVLGLLLIFPSAFFLAPYFNYITAKHLFI